MSITIGELIGNFILVTGSVFLLFYLIKRFAWTSLMDIFRTREEQISSDLDQAQTAREEASHLARQKEEELREARRKASKIMEDAKTNAQLQSDKILTDAKSEVSQLKDKAAADIAHKKSEALDEAKSEVASLSLLLAEKLLGQEMDQASHSRLIDAYLEQLGDQS